jgi:DNA-binding response OmpR family regulator
VTGLTTSGNVAGRRRILIIEDEPDLVRGLRAALEFEGFEVLSAGQGRDGVKLLRERGSDLVLLDLMLPDANGFAVCEAIRGHDALVPIIMLTARGQEADKIRGLNAGADDYVTKPFSIGELVARIRAAVRRGSRNAGPSAATFAIGAVTIDAAAHTLVREGETTVISFYEAELLKLQHRRAGDPVSRDEIREKVWGTKAHQPNNRTVDNFVVKLRKKIEPNHEKPRHILTVYGYGYKLVL